VIVTLLLAALVGFVVYLGSQRLSGLALAIVLGIAAVGAVLVISPDLATRAAIAVGVGRGTDLVLYVAIVGGLFVVAHLFLRIRRSEAQIVELARQLALSNAAVEESRANAVGETSRERIER
jgi:hypothetical protein